MQHSITNFSVFRMKLNRDRRSKRSAGRRGAKALALPGTGRVLDTELNKRIQGIVSSHVNNKYMHTTSYEELRSSVMPKSGVVSHAQVALMLRQVVLYSLLCSEMLDRSQRAIQEKLEEKDSGKLKLKNRGTFWQKSSCI